MKFKKRFKNQKGFALGLVIIIVVAFAIMTSAFFLYNDLELTAFNNSKKDKLIKASANLGIETAYKEIVNNTSQNFLFYVYASSFINSACISGINNFWEYNYQQSKQNLNSDFSSDDYTEYGYEYFIKKNFIDDYNIDYTIIACATLNSNPVTYVSLDLTTSYIEGNSNAVAIKRLGSGNIAF